jgi:hypothetical protein
LGFDTGGPPLAGFLSILTVVREAGGDARRIQDTHQHDRKLC